MENDKIISLTNLFHIYYISAEIYLIEKIEFILSYLVRNFKISAKHNQRAKYLNIDLD